jgi:hypothetical protein
MHRDGGRDPTEPLSGRDPSTRWCRAGVAFASAAITMEAVLLYHGVDRMLKAKVTPQDGVMVSMEYGEYAERRPARLADSSLAR